MSQAVKNTEDIPGRVNDVLVSEYGEDQGRKVKGYVRTQSIRELFKYLDPDDIVRLKARRLVKDKTESFGRLQLPSIEGYTSLEEQLKRQFVIDYDRLEHGKFNWPEIRSIIEGEGFGDVAVERLVYKFESQQLYERLLNLLDDVYNYRETGASYFSQPFHADLSTSYPGHEHAREEVMQYNDQSLFKEMGWKIRTLDLDAIWSLDAWRNTKGKVLYDFTQRQIEDMAFNNGGGEQTYGAINSTIVYNAWRNSISPSAVSYKEWEWNEGEDWEQVQ